MTRLTLEELKGKVKEGDSKALSEVYKRFNKLICNSHKRIFSRLELSEDIEQITRIGIWKGILKEGEIEKNIVWTVRRDLHKVVEYNKAKMRLVKVDGKYLSDVNIEFCNKIRKCSFVEGIHFKVLLEKVLRNLSKQNRKIVILLYRYGKQCMVAKELKITDQAVNLAIKEVIRPIFKRVFGMDNILKLVEVFS